MKYLIIIFLVFSGCGNNIKEKKVFIDKPYKEDKGDDLIGIEKIRAIIKNGGQYIIVGDSTRAKSEYQGHYIYNNISSYLSNYNVNTILLAKAGHTAKELIELESSPTIMDIINNIPENGDESIVDISLGINDYWNGYDIKSNISRIIEKIKEAKPKTSILLTLPNKAYNNKIMNEYISREYLIIANKYNLVLIDAMPDNVGYEWYRDDGFGVHLKKIGQEYQADKILKKILP
jgi:hypothetical protein